MKRNYLRSYRLHIVATRLFTILTIGVLTIVCPDFAYSGYVKVGDLYYTTDDDSMTAKVTYEKYQNYSNYSGLKSIHIPNSVTVNGKVYSVKSIGDDAFYRAKDLAYVSMDVGISYIGKFAFNECSSLISIIFPENLESIGEYAFFRCNSLQDVVLPKGLYSIGQRAFQECSKLKSVEFPASITMIGHGVFIDTHVKNIYLKDLSSWCMTITDTPVFSGVENVYIKGERIERLDIPDGVKKINTNTFSGLKCVNSISLPSTLQRIGKSAFYGCEFSSLYIKDIKSWCNVMVETGNFSSFDRLYVNDELVNTLIVPDGVTGVYENVFKGIKSIHEVHLPESLVFLGNNSFSECDGLKSICLPCNTVKVEDDCFGGCRSLVEIIVEEGENSLSLGKNSFRDCPVEKIYLGKNVSDNAFQNLESINYVEIGENVDDCRSLKWMAYAGLQTIVSKAPTPPLSQTFLEDQYKNVIVSVPETSKAEYERDPVWGPFWGVFPAGISLEESQVTISPGESMVLKVILTPDNVTQTSLTWESSDENIVQVDETGKITGVKDGEAKITASTINGLKAVCTVSVKSLPESIVLNVSGSLELNIGEPFQISATVLPEGCRDNEVYWHSDNDDVVSIKEGRLFTHRQGTACVSASTANGVSAQFTIDVADERFSVEIVPDTIEMYYAHESVIDIVVHAKTISKKDIQLNIGSTNIAYFKNDSTLIGNDLGTTILTASYADEVYSTNIVNVLPFKLTIDNGPDFVHPNSDFYLDKVEVSILPEDMASKLDVYWTAATTPGESMFSSNSITCWRPTTVKYKAYVRYGEYVFYSNEGILKCTNVLITTPDSLQTSCGRLETLNANVSLYSRYETPHTSTVWVSSDSEVVEIVKSELNSCEFISHKPGMATITATVNTGANCSTIIIVEEAVPVETISLNPDKWEGMPGEEFEIEATIYPENASDKTLVWSSSNTQVAEVDQYGHVKTLRTGEALITAESKAGSGVVGECFVKVNPIPVESIELSYYSWTGVVDDAFRINTVILPVNAYDKNVIWSSSDEKVAQVNQAGVVLALSPGEADITATAADGSGVSATCHVTVHPKLVGSVELTPDSWSGHVGETFTIIAAVLPENVTDKSLIWSSGDESVATVDSEGSVTALSPGEADITATAADGSGVSATCHVTVLPVLVESIVLTPDTWSGETGMTVQIEASVLPENASEKKLRWVSSDKSVAIVDEDGFVVVLKEGSCVITATATDGSGVYAECVVTGKAGIDEIFSDADRFDIHDLNGVLVKKDGGSDDLKTIAPGIYIIRIGDTMKKIVIR